MYLPSPWKHISFTNIDLTNKDSDLISNFFLDLILYNFVYPRKKSLNPRKCLVSLRGSWDAQWGFSGS